MYRPKKALSRRQMAALLAMMISLMPFSIDAYLPALPQMAASLATDIHHIEKSLSSFIFGVAIGQLLGGSLSDIKGRRNLALTGLVVYVAASAMLVWVQSHEQLLLLRIIQALGAGMSAVTVGAIVRDNYHGRDAAQMFALIGMIVMIAPLIAPLVGSALQSIGNWRWIFAFLWLYGLTVALMLYWFLPQHKLAEPITRAQVKQIGVRYVEVLRTLPAMGFLVYQAAAFAAMLVFLTESPFVYMQLYGLSSHEYAWLFGGNVVMMMVCNRLTAWGLRHQWHSRQLLLLGIGIQLVVNLALVVSVGLLKQPPLLLLAPLLMLSVGTQGLIGANTQALFMSNFKPEIGGSANAVLSAGQSLIAAMIAFSATILHNGSIMVMVGLMLACTVLGSSLLYYFSAAQVLGKQDTLASN